eukprot:6213209-Pleurochrysis_carterae.AAC.4
MNDPITVQQNRTLSSRDWDWASSGPACGTREVCKRVDGSALQRHAAAASSAAPAGPVARARARARDGAGAMTGYLTN